MAANVRKISISLDPRTHAWASNRADTEGKSLSAIIEAALRMEQQNEAALRVVERIGAFASPEETAALVAEWAGSAKATRRRAVAKPRTRKARPVAEKPWRRKSA